MGDVVRVEIGDGSEGAPAGVATIRLERPPMNALNTEMQEQLRAAADQLGRDEAVRAVVIYGGEKVFAAGADVKEMSAMGYAEMVPVARGRLTGSTPEQHVGKDPAMARNASPIG